MAGSGTRGGRCKEGNNALNAVPWRGVQFSLFLALASRRFRLLIVCSDLEGKGCQLIACPGEKEIPPAPVVAWRNGARRRL